MSDVNFFRASPLRKKYIEAKSRLYVYRSNLEVMRAFKAKKPVSSNNTGVVGGLVASGVALFALASVTLSGPQGADDTVEIKAVATQAVLGEPVNSKIAQSFSILSNTTSAAPFSEEKHKEKTKVSPEPEKKLAAIAPVEELREMETPAPPLLPKPKASLPRPEGEHSYILAVDKVRREVLVLKEGKDSYIIAHRFNSIFGSESGDKVKTGDLKTPEGLYYIVSIKEDADLPEKYGPRAYVLNYPNKLDRKKGKSGYGIWIHGSGLGEKIEPTEGCVEVNDKNIIALGWYATVGTPVYIFPEEFEIPINGVSIAKNIIDPDTLYAIKELGRTPETEKILKAAFAPR